ncbi:MAG: Uma2 family endonuclease [Alphaproteobacteria bacterium]|nr:Uma2 family endonuclease [Alphaproteobacteria bacterium]
MDVRATDYTNGLKRRAFTNAEVARMVEVGLLDGDERLELLRGEIVPMPSEYDLHGRARWILQSVFSEALGRRYFLASELSLFLFDDTKVKPDLHVFDPAMRSEDVRGPDVLLVVELSASSHHRDFRLKLPLYAEAGVPEVWIIDLDAREGHSYSQPLGAGYSVHAGFGVEAAMVPLLLPDASLRPGDLLR